MYFVLLFQVNGLKLSLEGAYREMEQLRKSLSEKEDLAQEEALIKETQARQALQEQLREQQDQHREETDRLLRYSAAKRILERLGIQTSSSFVKI